MDIGQICSRDVVTVSVSSTLFEAAETMLRRHVGALVVTAGHRQVVGVVTDRDVVQAQLQRTADLSRLSVGEVMTKEPHVLRERDTIAGGLAHLQRWGVRRAPVVDGKGSLVGFVSTDDLLAELSQQLLNLSDLVGQQRRLESSGTLRTRHAS